MNKVDKKALFANQDPGDEMPRELQMRMNVEQLPTRIQRELDDCGSPNRPKSR